MKREARRWRARLLAGAGLGLSLVRDLAAGTAPQELPPIFVTATRAGEDPQRMPLAPTIVEGDEVRAAAPATVDGLLRQLPGFSLFRRSDSLVANPTTQGVSLRGVGPSGASRSLVLLDGVPLNDPFGGWVLWSKVPRESLARIEVVPGAGGTAWGNAALGGAVQLFTEPPDAARQRFVVRAGSAQTLDVEAQFTEPVGAGVVQLLGRTLSTDGYPVVADEQRGPIDVPASSRARWGTVRWRQPVGEKASATLTVRRFAEWRGNGTPYQTNRSDESFASLAVAAQPAPGFQWNAVAYAQSQGFASTFSSVNAARTAETPASHQFAVPATALGLAWVGEWGEPETRDAASGRTTLGFDGRDVRGETREDAGYEAGGFTRRRHAGGRQTTGGVFLLHHRALPGGARGLLGVRADGWRETDGHRRDEVRGLLDRDENFAARTGVELSPTLGVRWPASGAVQVHTHAQQAFRRPTLNELHRAFRLGNVITEANPALRTERVTNGELGVTAGRGGWTLRATGFWNELRDAVANVTLVRGPVTLPDLGFVPDGTEVRRRQNLDRIRVRGVTWEATWQAPAGLSFDAQYFYNDARVLRAPGAAALVGRRLAQVPDQTASAGVTWSPGYWRIAPRVRWVGEQFEDDQNRWRLAAATLMDVAVSMALSRNVELLASAENVFDHRIETGRSATGLVSVGTPRLFLVGLRLWR